MDITDLRSRMHASESITDTNENAFFNSLYNPDNDSLDNSFTVIAL